MPYGEALKGNRSIQSGIPINSGLSGSGFSDDGQPVTSSRNVAYNFGKQHKDVLEAIRKLAAENSATKNMFYETTFENRGKSYPAYLMNRDGFSLLVMGFTGSKAASTSLHANERVLTTEQLAEVYGCEPIQIQQNFANNKDRFVEGKHYFKLTGEQLKEFKANYLENFELVDKRAPHIYLWTKRGASRHSKMLGTDKAILTRKEM